MDIQTRANDATKRVIDTLKCLSNDRLPSEYLQAISDEWYDYFYDLLSDELDEDDLFGG